MARVKWILQVFLHNIITYWAEKGTLLKPRTYDISQKVFLPYLIWCYDSQLEHSTFLRGKRAPQNAVFMVAHLSKCVQKLKFLQFRNTFSNIDCFLAIRENFFFFENPSSSRKSVLFEKIRFLKIRPLRENPFFENPSSSRKSVFWKSVLFEKNRFLKIRPLRENPFFENPSSSRKSVFWKSVFFEKIRFLKIRPLREKPFFENPSSSRKSVFWKSILFEKIRFLKIRPLRENPFFENPSSSRKSVFWKSVLFEKIRFMKIRLLHPFLVQLTIWHDLNIFDYCRTVAAKKA